MQYSREALRQAEELGLTRDQLQHMATHVAPFRHDLGNRRYEDYVLSISDETVWGVWQIDEGGAVNITGRREYDCPTCEGAAGGCHACDFEGTITCSPEEYDRLKTEALIT